MHETAARFPVLKELANFDFSALPKLNKAEILDLSRGEYIQKRSSLILIENPSLEKTHLAIGIALAACRQRRKGHFGTAASLVNELLLAQDEHRLHRVITTALEMDLVVLDELGFIPFTAPGSQALFTFCSELDTGYRLTNHLHTHSLLESGGLQMKSWAFCDYAIVRRSETKSGNWGFYYWFGQIRNQRDVD